MATRKPFYKDEWYHCYNRGVDKRKVFSNKRDYERFLILMHTGNSPLSFHISNMRDSRFESVFSNPDAKRGEPLVEIGAFCLMPNHFHMLVREAREGGIGQFMQKVFTGYTMYFNKKYERNGPLFAGAFKAKHVTDDAYLKQLVSYIHLNPVELFEPQWKSGRGKNKRIEGKLRAYPYSSIHAFTGQERPENILISPSIFSFFDNIPSATTMIANAKEYYEQQRSSL